MDYNTISEIQVTRTDGTIEIYRGQGLEKFKKMNMVKSEVVPVSFPQVLSTKYAQSGVTIKPLVGGNIFEHAEQMKKASGFTQ